MNRTQDNRRPSQQAGVDPVKKLLGMDTQPPVHMQGMDHNVSQDNSADHLQATPTLAMENNNEYNSAMNETKANHLTDTLKQNLAPPDAQ